MHIRNNSSMVFFIAIYYLLFSGGSFALVIDNNCNYFESGKKSNFIAIENFFSSSGSVDGIGGLKVCFSGEMASVYHLSKINKQSGVNYYYSDLVFKGKSDPLMKIKTLPYKGRINSHPSLYMCIGVNSCDNYESNNYSLISGMDFFLYKKVHDCLIGAASNEDSFKALFSDGIYHSIDGITTRFDDYFSNILQIRKYIFNGKDHLSLSFNIGNHSSYPAYEMDIYSDKSWKIVFELNESCISVKEVFEVEY